MKSRSKKIILLFFSLLAIGGAVFLLLKSKNGTEVKKVAETKIIKSPSEALVLDSDGDGLKDWEETLWGLDPHNPDTGGTGVPDAEKVKRKMKAIDAVALSKNSADSDAINSQYATDTETNTISKKLFAEYIDLKQSGNLNEETINATANRLVDETLKNKKAVQYYSPKDIKTFPSGDTALLKSYGNSFASIRTKYVNQALLSPLFKEGGTNNIVDPEILKGFVAISGIYKNMAMELSKLAVPKDLVDTHIEILNNYMASSDGLKEIGMLATDPVTAMVGMQRHTEAENKENDLLKTVAKNLFEKGVAFSKNEPGDFWKNI